MKTKEITEGLLYVAQDERYMRMCLEICHVLNDRDRNWSSSEHTEFHFLDSFRNPYFLMFVDKQIHLYLIGDKAKGKTYNILNIEGYDTELFTMAKSAINKEIVDTLRESRKQFLPSPLSQRIIFINSLKGEFSGKFEDLDIYIFNRSENDDNILKKGKWTLGLDMYSAGQREYITSVSEILKECLKELEEG